MTTATSSGRGLTADQRSSFIAALLGWTMDAFDYFVVVLVYADVAKAFGVSLTRMAFLTTVTLVSARWGRCSLACGPTGRDGASR